MLRMTDKLLQVAAVGASAATAANVSKLPSRIRIRNSVGKRAQTRSDPVTDSERLSPANVETQDGEKTLTTFASSSSAKEGRKPEVPLFRHRVIGTTG